MSETVRPLGPEAAPAPRHPLLAILVNEFNLAPEAVSRVAAQSDGAHASVGALKEQLLHHKLVTPEVLQQALARLFRLDFKAHLDDAELLPDFARHIPIRYAKRFMLFPIGMTERELTVAVEDPETFEPVTDVGRLFKRRVRPVVSTHQAILSLINRAYDRAQASTDEVIDDIDMGGDAGSPWGIDEPEDLIDAQDEEPIKRLLNNILYQAAKANASDVHVDATPAEVVVRFRVDGVLHTTSNLPKSIQRTLINRVKIMSRLDISQHGLPQDGRTVILIAGRKIDIRVSIMPTVHGEKAVMRLLFQDEELFNLHDLGMPDDVMRPWNRLVHQNGGILLVSGPTGSGKTTTLYAALKEIDHHQKNIMTIEDPVEYKVPGYVQTEVNPRLGLTFANALRSVLRQDPDVIMVGEMRDRDTAEIAIQAALTGHTVFSTVHTNNAPATITRLVDMGVESYLVSSTVMGVLAQRLVRRICPDCRTRETADKALLRELGLKEEALAKWPHLYRGKGCTACNGTGYRGRTGLFELLVVDDAIKHVINQSNESNVIRAAAVKRGMKTMRHYGLLLIWRGVTTVEEVLAATREE